jgi:hypothetical protein
MRGFRALILCGLAACAAIAVHCSKYPVDTSGRDLIELESVWQYLKAYSIWQDSVPLPPNAFTYSAPETLLAHVNDTLRGHSYTGYASAGGADAEAAVINPTSPIVYGSVSPRTAYIHVWDFTRDTTFDSFLVAIPVLAQYPNIMLDLRWNTGGDISVMDSIIEYFLPVNTPFIHATYRAYDEASRTASTVRGEHWTTKHAHSPTLAGKNIVILLNHWSASASEMLAAGIKDGRATAGFSPCPFVGDTSYGKGIGQVLINRAWMSKRDLSITFLRVVRACNCADSVYHRKGLVPDIKVTNPDSTVADTAQFCAAFHVLEPGVTPNVIYITRFSHTLISKRADFVGPAILEMEKQ